jgi:molybdopterin/thiamine biosynthesis adenylyltransferase
VIAIVGVGALGSHAALALRNHPQGLRVIDFDRVESKNILAQFHTKMSLQKNKARAFEQAMKGLFGVRTVSSSPHRLTNDNSDILLSDAELVMDCTDNLVARCFILSIVNKLKIPCIHGALSGDGKFARIVWSELFVPDEEGEEGEATCMDGENLPFFMMTGALLAAVAQDFLETGRKANFQGTPSGFIKLS